ncbi:heterokaryon incompatibility protein-domain-containing protein [Lasiosphaeria miniovina]|uniref:Heterokaryon incompatibility protein-domain-containing protein n=1 Tax=Lasiosphaeria miniovina TaxID=1954250 RepID=A0AA40A0I5_9PEZI|nr:heterokaryon incompatibility protein-domain-containing protein [Lasiosphaeria miniovina]KAK0707035.1 heterokaryon incompatibility protein-domain-containing protein [Lasiosphaeria miniovina]
MASRCGYCAGLSIERLVDLAKTEFSAHAFPQRAFYQHHPSFGDVEQSATGGCDLCQLILECFRGTPWDDCSFWPSGWEGPRLDIDKSAYAAAKQLDVSDVKLCINTDHVWSSQPLESVSLFNKLLVHVGPIQEDDEEDSDWPFPFLSLALSTPRDVRVAIDNWRIGRLQVDPHLGAPVNHAIARKWLQDCETLHPACSTGQIPELPTRVIDVGTDEDAPEDARLVLSEGRRERYVALSHCWGGPITTLLTTDTYSDFQIALPHADLPANFRDAIIITRELSIRYLWIDSLCILQDSKLDWAAESKKMGTIYRDSAVTVSAVVAHNSAVGILDPRPMYRSTPAPTTLRVYEDRTRREEVRVEWVDAEDECLRNLALRGPLFTRAWTLQEFILSSKHVLYGNRQMYWRCPAGFKSADDSPGDNKFPTESYHALSDVVHFNPLEKLAHDGPLSREACLDDYYDLVVEYSSRNITFDSDKFPAFSGVAQRLQPVIGGDYLAGLWSSDFCRGLLWYAGVGQCIHVPQYRAPSWSWAVSNDEVLFGNNREDPLLPSGHKAQLVGYSVVLQDETTPFGELTSAYLVLKAPTKTLVRSSQVVSSYQLEGSVGLGYFDEPNRHVADDETSVISTTTDLFMIENDSASDEDYILSVITRYGEDGRHFEIDFDLFDDVELVVMLVHARDRTPDALPEETVPAQCLVLRSLPGKGENTYERVGYAALRLAEGGMRWLETWESRELKLV